MDDLARWCTTHENVEHQHTAMDRCVLVESRMATQEEQDEFFVVAKRALSQRAGTILVKRNGKPKEGV